MLIERFSSRAFRRGVAMGFSAPLRVAAGQHSRVTYVPRATDAAAWREVGNLLNQAYREVGAELVKTPGRKADEKQPA